MCAACHSTGLRKRYEPGADRFATAWQELDVSCEACHGPGSRHVAWAERGADRRGDPSAGLAVRLGGRGEWQRAPEADTAVRVSVAAASPELDTCARCHARRSALVETDPDGRPFLDSYRPALLHDGLYFADGQILDEVYEWGSFVQSRMHHAGVTCSDCHEPHSLSLRHDGNALCAQCHSPARFDAPSHHFHAPGTPGSRCVDCHMPERTYMVVDVRRDHSFRVPRPDLSGPIGAPDACTSCHDGRTPEWAAAAIRAHLGEPRRREPHFGGDLHAARAGDRDAGERLRRLAADAGAPAIARATALSMLDSWPGPATTAAVGRAAMDAEPLVRLGAASTLLAIAPAEQRRFLRLCDDPLRAVRVEAARALAPLVHDPSLAVSERTSLERALDELVESQRLDGDRAAAHVVLALLAVRTGDPATAEAEYRTAIRLDPTAIEARVNLADLYRDLDRDAEGEVVLREAIALASDSAEAHHALGLLLVRQRRLADALPFLMRADELRPENPRFGYVYGVALHEAGDTSSALRVLARTHERHPAGRDVLVALTTIARDHGDLAAAHRWADALCALAPDDETARELRDSLRRR
jgi:Tfp pilus assembly protein PilF